MKYVVNLCAIVKAKTEADSCGCICERLSHDKPLIRPHRRLQLLLFPLHKDVHGQRSSPGFYGTKCGLTTSWLWCVEKPWMSCSMAGITGSCGSRTPKMI